MRPKGMLYALYVGAVTLALAGCGGGTNSNQSWVRSFNAYIPSQGTTTAITVTANNIILSGSTAVGFGQVANGGGYVAIAPGTFNPSGTGTNIVTPITFVTPPTLAGNNAAFTLLAAGQAGQSGALAPQFYLVPNYTTDMLTIPSGSSGIRVVNLSANSDPIGLYTTSNGLPSAALAPSLGSVAYGYTAAANQYAAVTTTDIANLAVVDTTNTGTALTVSALSNLNKVTFISGQAYTLYVYGLPGNPQSPFSATWVLDFPAL